jgi:hypothetical protein
VRRLRHGTSLCLAALGHSYLPGKIGRPQLNPGRVPEHPAAGDSGIGGGWGGHEPIEPGPGEELLQFPTPLPIGTVALVAAVVAEEVENDGCGRCSGDQIAHPPPPGAEPVLQRAEVEPAGPPDHEFPVEDHAFVELGHRGGDVLGSPR